MDTVSTRLNADNTNRFFQPNCFSFPVPKFHARNLWCSTLKNLKRLCLSTHIFSLPCEKMVENHFVPLILIKEMEFKKSKSDFIT